MKTFAHMALAIAVSFALGSATLSAGQLNASPTSYSVVATADTFITNIEGYGFGGALSTNASYGYLFSTPSPGWDSTALMQFNLASYSGQAVAGPATLALNVLYAQGATPENLSLDAILVSWNPATASWSSFGGIVPGTTVAATPVADAEFTVSTGTQLTFTLSSALVQSWINSPGTNYGVALLQNSWAGIDPDFYSGNPTLTFSTVAETSSSTVPEPGTATLLAGAILILGGRFLHRRRSSV
jgi:hypothetical protein